MIADNNNISNKELEQIWESYMYTLDHDTKIDTWVEDKQPVVKEVFGKIWDTYVHTMNNNIEIDNAIEDRHSVVYEVLNEVATLLIMAKHKRNESDYSLFHVQKEEYELLKEEYIHAIHAGYLLMFFKEKIINNTNKNTANYRIKPEALREKILDRANTYKQSFLESSLCHYYSQSVKHTLSQEITNLPNEWLDQIKGEIFFVALYGMAGYMIEDMWKEL